MTVLIALALLCFILATMMAIGILSASWSAALLPAGLAFYVASALASNARINHPRS